MFLTLETLEQYKACENGKKWFARHFPEGGELIDVISHKYATPEILHWGYTHLPTTAEEQRIYWEKLQIDCEETATIYECDHIKDCKWVTRSSHVEDSEFVFSSKNVTHSEDISLSEDVSDSQKIFGSEFVYSSKRVAHSKNVTDSYNIVNSDYVVNSHSIMNASAVTNSAFVDAWLVGGSRQLKDCRFIMDCTNLKHSLFCHKISDGEYMVFNKQVDAADYELIVKQLDKILANYEAELVVEGEWPYHTIPLDSPKIQRNIIKQYGNLPSTFWRWVKTLPGYDPSVLYAITYSKELI
jgi:hypothetical protein